MEDKVERDQGYSEEVARILKDEDLSDAARVKALHELGFSRKQLMQDFNFSRSLVYDVLPVKADRKESKPNNDETLPTVLKGSEVITPEGIMQHLVDGSRDWELRLEGMYLLRAAQRMVMDDVQIMREMAKAEADAMKPVLQVMKEAREELDAAAERAKGSVIEVARETAALVAEHFDERLSRLEDKKRDIAEVAHPLEGVMARTIETLMGQLMSRLLGTAQEGQAQLAAGWTDRRQQGG